MTDSLPPLRRDDPDWRPTVLSNGYAVSALMIGGKVVMVPNGRGGLQPLPDDWEEQNGWARVGADEVQVSLSEGEG